MEVLFAIVGSLAAKAAEYTVDPTARQLGYLFKHKTKFLNLRTKVQDLEGARERVQQSIEAATRKGEVIFEDVQRWLTVADEKISEQAAKQLREDEEKATKRCFAGFCPDFKSRYQLSRKAEKEVNAIAQLLTEKDAFKDVSYLPAVEVTDIIRPVKEYEAFGSRSFAFDGVMAALEDDTVSKIGVYGMGGVGKTTLVKEVARQAKVKLSFDEVIFVAVTQTPKTVDLQNEIAHQLGMKLDNNPSVDVQAARLCDRLKKAKKVLVILDDIWEEQEVDTLGIPSADQHRGCKILMTSRRLDVLKRMDSHPNIPIETLNEDEAWNLFKKMAGHIVESSEIRSIAVEVAKRCAGLPIAIATIAKALKPKDKLFEWRDALRQLSKPSERNFKGIPAGAYSAIEFSYKFIEDGELGPIFLLCSIMRHNATVEELLRYAIGLGFIHDVNTMEESRDRVLTLVNNLTASCLLLEGSHPNCFDMHDVVRDVAQSIASRDRHWLALFKELPNEEKMKESQLISLQNAEVNELLYHELECPTLNYFSIGMYRFSSLKISNDLFKGMQRLKVLEFGRTNFTTLPFSLGFLKTLCTLRLMYCDIEDIAILGELGNLEILDLRGSRMKMLPKEIGQLTRLKLLDLTNCGRLKVISPNVLSSLSRLEELYLYNSFDKWEVEGIENPRSKASLVELHHLSRLTTLEIHIRHAKAIPKDNLFLGKMKRFKISIGNKTWNRFDFKGVKTSRMLKLRMNKIIHLVNGIKLLLGKIQSLYLEGLEDVEEMLYYPSVEPLGQLEFMKVKSCHRLKNLFSFSIAKRLRLLEELEVSDCMNLTELIVEKEEISENDILEFSKLRFLKLERLKKFNGSWLFDEKVSCPALEELCLKFVGGIEKIWHIDDQLSGMSFGVQSLRDLNVCGCNKLKYVFTSSMVKSLVHLKTLYVSGCDEMEEIIEGTLAATEEERIKGSISVFPKLHFMCLDGLPKSKRFCSGSYPIEFPSLRELRLKRCPELKTFLCDSGKSGEAPPNYLFNEKVILAVLEELEICKMGNLERLWCDQLAQHSFSTLTSIHLKYCRKLLNVFPLSMLTRLQRLDYMCIVGCESVEEIIFESESQEGGSSRAMTSLSSSFIQSDVITFEFPILTSLDLSGLPNLRSIHHTMHTINWPSLKKLDVSRCDKVEILFACQETSGNNSHHPLFWVNESTFQNLHELTLGWNAGIKDIICHCEAQQQHQLLSHCLPNLKVVNLYGYPEQLTLLPSYLFHLLALPNLQTLEIICSSFKEMRFQSEEGGEEKPASLLLSQITELNLYFLHELMHLWKEKEGFPNLRILDVYECHKLEGNLVPSSASFRNLVTLKVERCDGIIKLITHPTAKSLVHLKEMSITRCSNIKEIIQGGDDHGEFSFPLLNRLALEDLPKLESFCSSGNYTFSFPYLEDLVVENCPKMKMFSQGHSNTPMLHKVRLKSWGVKELLEGSLNSTIQHLFREKHAMNEEGENSKEDQSKPSTSDAQINLITF
ncbi:disease resistance protein At4g27190-like [Hibiscus syriacus]|uniref:disease resistance protein At4g27190-like n=1 Tax=Hibiscus syriacus TaxID=106335 RepID=UPI0019227BA1|nr:disease resistance protein At4g27190-like [Hibiscus syriacus]